MPIYYVRLSLHRPLLNVGGFRKWIYLSQNYPRSLRGQGRLQWSEQSCPIVQRSLHVGTVHPTLVPQAAARFSQALLMQPAEELAMTCVVSPTSGCDVLDTRRSRSPTEAQGPAGFWYVGSLQPALIASPRGACKSLQSSCTRRRMIPRSPLGSRGLLWWHPSLGPDVESVWLAFHRSNHFNYLRDQGA